MPSINNSFSENETLVKLIPNYIYFYHLKKFCVIPTYPDSITDSIRADFSTTQALSRTAPVFTYTSSGPRSVNFTLKLHRDLMNDVNKDTSNIRGDNLVVPFWEEDYIDILIKYLQSIALPRYQIYDMGSRGIIPPMIAVRFGDQVFIKGVVNSDIQVTYEKPIMVGNKYAQATITFNVTEVDPYDADTVVKDGSFRGITSTFRDGIYESTAEYSSAAPWQETEFIFNNYQDNVVLGNNLVEPISTYSFIKNYVGKEKKKPGYYDNDNGYEIKLDKTIKGILEEAHAVMLGKEVYSRTSPNGEVLYTIVRSGESWENIKNSKWVTAAELVRRAR